MIEQHYELRYIETSSVATPKFSLFDDQEERLTLLDFIKNNERVLLLGNPGVGKTTELKNIFKILWDAKQETKEVPLYINIKNFRQTSTIEDLIQFEDWKKMPSVVLILDGLDEIGNIQDFISELEIFMSRYSKLNLKYVISCRTNIYQKYLINISNFKIAYLKSLSIYQVESIIKHKYKLEIPLAEIDHYFTILQTPFNLDLFATYYSKNGRFPNTIEESWQLFLDAEIDRAQKLLIKRFTITNAEIFNALQKVAITNELMQQNSIEEVNLLKLLGEHGISIFQELPFVTKQHSSNNYVFIHKNYQEYFAAKYISSLPIDEIIQFIKAEDLDKIKPNLFNTTTFLLNILHENKFATLKDWLLENDIEVLFFADDNRLEPALQNEIFERFFNEFCIGKTYWLSNHGKISLNILAKFASFDFLSSQINDKTKQDRVRLSALEVLAQKSLTQDQEKAEREILVKLLNEESNFFKAEILRAIKTQKFYKRYPEYWTAVLDIVKETDDKDILHQIIAILSDLDDKNRDQDLFIDLVKRFYSTYDSVIRGTENHLAYAILSTNDPNLNLSFLKLLFDENHSLRSNSIFLDNFDEKIIEKVKSFSTDPQYVQGLAEMAFSGRHRIMSNPLLHKLLLEVELSPKIILDILKKEKMSSDILYSICSYLNIQSIDAIIEAYKKGDIKFNPLNNIVSFRNWLAHTNYDLAMDLEKKFIETGYEFAVSLRTKEEVENEQKKFEEFQAYNFNLLFDKDEIINEVIKYFKKHNLDKLSNAEFRKEFFMKWYDESNYHGIQYTIHTVLETAFRFHYQVTPAIIEELFKDPHFYLTLIKSGLSHNSLKFLQLKEYHYELIDKLAKSLVQKIDFNDVIKVNADDPNRFGTTINFAYIKLILFFDINYNTIQSKDFYLNALEFGNIESHHHRDGESFIDYILKRVDDEPTVNKKIIQNINSGNLIYMAKQDHISYAIDKNLEECFEKIGKEIIADETMFGQYNILENYIAKLDNPLLFLKECCLDQKSHLHWFAIKLIKEYQLDNIFILNAALNYLKSEDKGFIDEAINILFFLNYEYALQSYFVSLKNMLSVSPDSSGLLPKDTINYKLLNELHLFENLFNLIYVISPTGSFYLHRSRQFMSLLTASLSSTNEGHSVVKNVLLTIKGNLDKKNDNEDFDHKTFYINDLIDTCNNSYLKFKSAQLSFGDALSRIK